MSQTNRGVGEQHGLLKQQRGSGRSGRCSYTCVLPEAQPTDSLGGCGPLWERMEGILTLGDQGTGQVRGGESKNRALPGPGPRERSPCTQWKPRPGRQEPLPPSPALPSSLGAASPAAEELGRWSLAPAGSHSQNLQSLAPRGNVRPQISSAIRIRRVSPASSCGHMPSCSAALQDQTLGFCYMASFSSHLIPTKIREVVVLYSLYR